MSVQLRLSQSRGQRRTCASGGPVHCRSNATRCRTRKAPVHGIILQHVRHILRVDERVVYARDYDVRIVCGNPEHQTPDSPKTVDSEFLSAYLLSLYALTQRSPRSLDCEKSVVSATVDRPGWSPVTSCSVPPNRRTGSNTAQDLRPRSGHAMAVNTRLGEDAQTLKLDR